MDVLTATKEEIIQELEKNDYETIQKIGRAIWTYAKIRYDNRSEDTRELILKLNGNIWEMEVHRGEIIKLASV